MKSREKIYKVIEITRLIKRSLEREFQDVWIEGEVSNLRRPKSGHIYFTIKDEYSQIQAVRFRPRRDDVFSTIKDGDKIRAFGNISVYEKSGQYQIYVQTAEKLGIGDLQVLFNKLKEKLQVEGLFDKKYKKAIPALPRTIAIVTSPTGAAIRDMINVLDRRFSNVHVLVYPVKVQGECNCLKPLDSCFRGCVAIQKRSSVQTVMPDVIRHPGLQYFEKPLDSGSHPE